MLRRTPLRPGKGFKRKAPVHQPAVSREDRPMAQLSPATRRGSYAGTASGQPVKKQNASQSAAYMEAVRNLGYCQLCGRVCRPQFCHRDEGKGAGIKTDVREGWNGCADCHSKVGTERIYPKEQRRLLELNLGALTRVAVLDAGTWPKRLPLWNPEK